MHPCARGVQLLFPLPLAQVLGRSLGLGGSLLTLGPHVPLALQSGEASHSQPEGQRLLTVRPRPESRAVAVLLGLQQRRCQGSRCSPLWFWGLKEERS